MEAENDEEFDIIAGNGNGCAPECETKVDMEEGEMDIVKLKPDQNGNGAAAPSALHDAMERRKQYQEEEEEASDSHAVEFVEATSGEKDKRIMEKKEEE